MTPAYIFLLIALLIKVGAEQGVRLEIQDRHVVIDNGILQLTLTKPGGLVSGISYGGMKNMLESGFGEGRRGYWDVVWDSKFQIIEGTSYKVIKARADQVEISFRRNWSPSSELIPLNVDIRYVVLRGSSGFYSYSIYERPRGWPGFNLEETRIAFKLARDRFYYMAVSDDRQRVMPKEEDREKPRSQVLAYKEAVRLFSPTHASQIGEVDDKYQYSSENVANRVHGWISSNPHVGFWQITASDEFRTGGLTKQDLTSHVGPTTLAMFHSNHYTGDSAASTFRQGEPWKKVFGPVFFYLNSANAGSKPESLWQDAKRQMAVEVTSWPYNFPVSPDFPSTHQRGSVTGRLLVQDRFAHVGNAAGASAYVGLAPPGASGSWQTALKGYQFWARTDARGYFNIINVRPGTYSLYGWVPGFIGEYKHQRIVTIGQGGRINLGDLIYLPPRAGPTVWEIGYPDRRASEFYVPDPDPKYVNKALLKTEDRFRQYGLWHRYTELYPQQDLVYTVGISNYQKNWFYAQVTRKSGSNSYIPTTWQIRFQLPTRNSEKSYVLQIAIASATLSELQVRFNDPDIYPPHFTTGLIGRDNSIARHGIHGLYWLYSVHVPGSRLHVGENIIYLKQARSSSAFNGIMYDYIRLEGPH